MRVSTTAPARRSAVVLLAEQPARQQVPASPRVGGVEQDEVEVAGQPAMLEAIVQHQHLTLQFLHRDGGQRGAIRSLEMRYVREVLLEHERLVVGPLPAPVAAAEDRHAQVASAVEVGDVLDARCLAGAAHRQVADADDRDGGPEDALPAARVGEVAQPDGETVREAGQPQAGAGQPGAGAAPLPAHQGQVVLAGGAVRIDRGWRGEEQRRPILDWRSSRRGYSPVDESVSIATGTACLTTRAGHNYNAGSDAARDAPAARPPKGRLPCRSTWS
jgi:hypothetical protein